jgi:putative peptide zinc metalloprotease protein
MTRKRLLATTMGLALLLTTGVPPNAAAQPGGGDNTAVAVNTKDGSDVFRLAFHVNRVASDTVDSANAAVAFASCSDCQTVAIAIQVVLIMSDPSVVTPENLAIAINQECSECDTLASAYQLVLSTGGPVRLSPEGRRRIAEIRRQLQELRRADLSSAEIQARVKALTAELREVVTTQLVPVGRQDLGGKA